MKKRLSVLIFALLTMSLLPMAAAAEESTPNPQRVYCYFETVTSSGKALDLSTKEKSVPDCTPPDMAMVAGTFMAS